jgi:hypothetical protein
VEGAGVTPIGSTVSEDGRGLDKRILDVFRFRRKKRETAGELREALES